MIVNCYCLFPLRPIETIRISWFLFCFKVCPLMYWKENSVLNNFLQDFTVQFSQLLTGETGDLCQRDSSLSFFICQISGVNAFSEADVAYETDWMIFKNRLFYYTIIKPRTDVNSILFKIMGKCSVLFSLKIIWHSILLFSITVQRFLTQY